MRYFRDFDHQDKADLEYGQQAQACAKLVKKDTTFKDTSIEGDWTPDED